MVSCVELNRTQAPENCFLAPFSWAFVHSRWGSSLQWQKSAGGFSRALWLKENLGVTSYRKPHHGG